MSLQHQIKYQGRTQTIEVWAAEVGVPAKVIKDRLLRYHWSVKDALKTPVGGRASLKQKWNWRKHLTRGEERELADLEEQAEQPELTDNQAFQLKAKRYRIQQRGSYRAKRVSGGKELRKSLSDRVSHETAGYNITHRGE